MGLSEVYKEFINLTQLPDDEKKAKMMEEFFRKLNAMQLPEYFNWAEEVFEGINVRERGDKTALIWSNLDTGEKKKFSYAEFAKEGNKLINALRGAGLQKGDNLYMMIPLFPEIWFATFASVKGGFIGVPTATIMTVRELEFRFKTYPPNAVIADENSAKVIDEAIKSTGV
ncbi:MAG: AMP-binding protein, partial [Archaeoglobaceae archaeon]